MTREELRGHCIDCANGIVTGMTRQEWKDEKGHKTLSENSIYCVCDIGHGARYPQFIKRKYEWTGLIPKWCPLIGCEVDAK